MKVHQLSNGSRLRPQKLSARDTPHVTIETNTTCNMRCKFCYANERPVTKTLEEVEAEIELAMERRNLDAISLLGGEPTLHPQICQIVHHVKSKGLICQFLTNGVRFLYHNDKELLRDLVAAGVDRFLVHIDSGQAHVHGDIDAARHKVFKMLEAHRVWFGLSLTLYKGEEADLPRIMKEYAKYRYFDGVLVTLALDFNRAFEPLERRRFEPQLELVADALHEQLHISPAAYIPSNLEDDEITWLMYFYWINDQTGETFALSPELNRAMKFLYRTMEGHEFFAETPNPRFKGLTLAGSAMAELALHPSRALEFSRLMREGQGTEHLRFHYIVIQQAPRMHPELGKIQFCWECPDATVRNGSLTPVCIAGRINPLGDEAPSAPYAVIRDVFEHLGEPLPERPG